MSASNVATAAALLLSLLLVSAHKVAPAERGGVPQKIGRHHAAEIRTEHKLDNVTGNLLFGPRNRSCFVVTGGDNCVNDVDCEAEHGPSKCSLDGKCRCKPGYCSNGRGMCSNEENRLVAGPLDLRNARYPRARLFLLSDGFDALTEKQADHIRVHALPGGGYALVSNDEYSTLCCTVVLHDVEKPGHCVFAGFGFETAEAPLCVFDLYSAPPFEGRPDGAVTLEAWALRRAPLVLEALPFEHPSDGVISSYQGENYGANSYWFASPEIPASFLKPFPGPECTSDCGAYGSGHGVRARKRALRHLGTAIYGLLWWALVTALYAHWRRGSRPSWDPKLTHVDEAEDWSTGVWDCHRDWNGCGLACCCPAIRWADTMSDAGIHNFWYAFVVFTLGGVITLFPWLSPVDAFLATQDRDQLRRHLKIQRRENQCRVCLLFFCCQACMVAQEGRHVDELVGKAAMVASTSQP